MATPPFSIDETRPQANDLISQYPGQSQTFRDVVESWLLSISDTDGVLIDSFPSVINIGSLRIAGPVLYRNSGADSSVRISGGNDDGFGGHIQLQGQAAGTFPSQVIVDGSAFRVRSQDGATTYSIQGSTALTLGTDIAIEFDGTGAATTRTNLGLGTGNSPTFAAVTTTGDVTVGDDLSVGGGFSALDGISQMGEFNIQDDSIYNDLAAGQLRIHGGNGVGLGGRTLWYGQAHATLPTRIVHAAVEHIFRASDGSTDRATISSSGLTLGTNLPIVFSGTGASTTRNNLGLGSMATLDTGTGGEDFRDNDANDARFYQHGEAIAVSDLPTSASERSRIMDLIAGAAAQAIGTYVMARYTGGATVSIGSTAAAADLTRAHSSGHDSTALTTGSVWQCQGYAPTNTITLWKRVS